MDHHTNKYMKIHENKQSLEDPNKHIQIHENIPLFFERNDEILAQQHLQIDKEYKPHHIPVKIKELENAHIDCIGEGCFGIVYRANIKKKGQTEISVAIKHLKENCGFAVHEFTLLSLCRHKNILAPFKLIGRRILVTEYMKNGTIEKYLIDEGALIGDGQKKQELFWKWACNISEGMHYLHTHQILHLDLHTGNILIRDDQTAVIGDFGQARGKRSHIDSPQIYASQMLKYSFVANLIASEKISSKTDVLFFGWLLSNFLQIDYKPSWEAPDVISTQQQQDLIKSCLTPSCSNRPPFSSILTSCQEQYRVKNN